MQSGVAVEMIENSILGKNATTEIFLEFNIQSRPAIVRNVRVSLFLLPPTPPPPYSPNCFLTYE